MSFVGQCRLEYRLIVLNDENENRITTYLPRSLHKIVQYGAPLAPLIVRENRCIVQLFVEQNGAY